MTDITRIAGSPGAGKTHELLKTLERERARHGVGMGDFSYITFTNAGREDATREVADLFNEDRDTTKGAVRTLHSAALGQLIRAEVIEDHDTQIITQESERTEDPGLYQAFADRHGMHYAGVGLQDAREKDVNEGAADVLFRLSEWLKLTQKPPEKARQAPFPLPWPTSHAARLLEEWEAFKRDYHDLRRFEHSDYVELAIERDMFPNVDVLLVDEFQDFSPLEYLYYREWRDSGTLDRVYLAGDPNQSIYSFRAGTPYYFNNTDADDEIELTDSYRCSARIADYARKVLNGGPGASVEFSGVHDGGVVERVDGANDKQLREALEAGLTHDDGVFLLARTNSKVHSIKRWLKRNGYPYQILGQRWRSVWDDSLTHALRALRTMQRDSGGVPRRGVNTLMAHTPQSELRKKVLEKHGDVYSVASVWKAFRDMDTVGQIVETLDWDSHKREALKNAALRPNGNKPSDVHIGTIHAAKGLERPAVLLFNSYNGYLEQQYYEDEATRAEEHRVAYVGATRASEQLYIVTGFFDGPVMHPLGVRA